MGNVLNGFNALPGMRKTKLETGKTLLKTGETLLEIGKTLLERSKMCLMMEVIIGKRGSIYDRY